MPGNGNRDTWRHCHKGAEPRHVMHVAFFTFSMAMLLALFHFKSKVNIFAGWPNGPTVAYVVQSRIGPHLCCIHALQPVWSLQAQILYLEGTVCHCKCSLAAQPQSS